MYDRGHTSASASIAASVRHGSEYRYLQYINEGSLPFSLQKMFPGSGFLTCSTCSSMKKLYEHLKNMPHVKQRTIGLLAIFIQFLNVKPLLFRWRIICSDRCSMVNIRCSKRQHTSCSIFFGFRKGCVQVGQRRARRCSHWSFCSGAGCRLVVDIHWSCIIRG